MLWIFALALIMPIDIGLCAEVERNVSDTTGTATVNLTAITWEHAVNSQAQLKSALANNVKMIEADVFWGTLIVGNETKTEQVIMAHGPDEIVSDLSLDDFIKQVNEYNKDKNAETVKGIKLDFKSIDAFTKSEELLKNIGNNYQVWLNADIVKGPVDARTLPVDPKLFFDVANKFPKLTLSLGWTTRWTNSGITSGKYTDKDVNEMITALESLKNKQQPITFPVRAGLVATSQAEMVKLLDKYGNATLTVWSGSEDEVDSQELQKLIKGIGVNKVYLDVPKSLSDKLDLGPEDTPNKSSASKVVHIGVVSIIMLILTQLL